MMPYWYQTHQEIGDVEHIPWRGNGSSSTSSSDQWHGDQYTSLLSFLVQYRVPNGEVRQ